jgi:hypothetical protein
LALPCVVNAGNGPLLFSSAIFFNIGDVIRCYCSQWPTIGFFSFLQYWRCHAWSLPAHNSVFCSLFCTLFIFSSTRDGAPNGCYSYYQIKIKISCLSGPENHMRS